MSLEAPMTSYVLILRQLMIDYAAATGGAAEPAIRIS
ncbi:hypothetical protein LCGC14_0131760 [marine sediment metagenome]|uniref:Uncharacterized protein n=1 Tax=marine sediment metagenome TaxID=412755 RepID=A0A0F9Y618_9ZZZZ